ncbi:hypothetical protein Tco_0280297 [Tanacetum coccineum]
MAGWRWWCDEVMVAMVSVGWRWCCCGVSFLGDEGGDDVVIWWLGDGDGGYVVRGVGMVTAAWRWYAPAMEAGSLARDGRRSQKLGWKKGGAGKLTEKVCVPQKVDEMNDLSNPVTSNSVPTPQESKVVKNDNVIAPGFLSSTGVDNTAKTRRQQPRSNTKNDRVPSTSKSSCIKNKEVEVEEHHRNLLLFKNKKPMSSECNNVKLAIWNDKSKVVCAMCKQCLITANHDVCVLNYVNGMNSRGSKERLASLRPKKPRTFLRWSPTGRIFDLKGKIITSSESECQSNCSNNDNACTSNPGTYNQTVSKFHFFSWQFLGTARFRNDHIAAILAMHNDYIGDQLSAALRTILDAQAPQVLQTPTATTTTANTAPTPTTSSSQATNFQHSQDVTIRKQLDEDNTSSKTRLAWCCERVPAREGNRFVRILRSGVLENGSYQEIYWHDVAHKSFIVLFTKWTVKLQLAWPVLPGAIDSGTGLRKPRARHTSWEIAVENVVEIKSHFSLEVVNQDLSSLAMITKHLKGKQRKRVVRFHGWRVGVVDGERDTPSPASKDGERWGVETRVKWDQGLIVNLSVSVSFDGWKLGERWWRMVNGGGENVGGSPMCSSMVERMVDRVEKRSWIDKATWPNTNTCGSF